MQSLADLVERAILWEGTLRDLYTELANAFPSHPTVEAFWRKMAIDESSHAELIRVARDLTAPENLKARLDSSHLEITEAAERLISRIRSPRLETLDDAYELAHEIESSEINVVFRLLITPLDSTAKHLLVSAQFDEHIAALTRFGRDHDKEFRSGVRRETPVGE